MSIEPLSSRPDASSAAHAGPDELAALWRAACDVGRDTAGMQLATPEAVKDNPPIGFAPKG